MTLGQPLATGRWSRPRPPATTAMVAMLLVSASFALLGALLPMTPQAPVRLNAALGTVGILLAACTWASPWRAWPHISLITTIAGLGLLVASAASSAGTAALCMSFTWTAAYAGFFFPARLARGYAAAGLASFGLGLLGNPFTGAAHVWSLTALTAVVGVEAITRLVSRLDRAATVDALTGVLNRAGLERRAEHLLRAGGRSVAPLSVVLVDLDGFKGINDRRGHAGGDELLRAVAGHWRLRLRPADVLARLGGDEFVLLLPDTDEAQAARLMTRLAVGSPTPWSFGTASLHADGALSQALLTADRRLYEAKARRRSGPVPAQRRPTALVSNRAG